MRVRLMMMMILLLILTTMTASAGNAPVVASSLPAGQEDGGLTPEEEQAALAVVRRFRERWRETNDIGQIIDEMFVNDFSERLWQVPQDQLPWALVDKTLIVRASPQELRRYYVAGLNFYGLYSRLQEGAEALREKSENKEELTMAEVLSPEVIDVLLGDRTFARLAELNKEGDSDENAKEDDNGQPAERADLAQVAPPSTGIDADESREQSETGIIKSLTQLNDASATLEKANRLMVRRLLKMQGAARKTSENDKAESDQDSQKPSLTDLEEEEYGYPKNTQIIHLDAARFCLNLIKIEGQFKIYSISIYVD